MWEWWSNAKRSQASWPEYWRRVARQWLAVIGVVLFGVGSAQVVLTDLAFPWWLWLIAGAVCLFLGQFLAFHDVRVERDDARATKAFPNVEIEIGESIFYVDLESELTPPRREFALIFDTRVTNRELAQRINLTFEMNVVWIPKPFPERQLKSRLFPTRQVTNRRYEEDLLRPILEVDGGHTRPGYLSFNHYSGDPATDHWIEFENWGEPDGEPAFASAKEDHKFTLTVHDFVSGQSVEFEVPGKWPSVGQQPPFD